jgi:hypothetical protein
MRLFTLLCATIISLHQSFAQPQPLHWKLDGEGGITRTVHAGDAFSDHIEMSGKYISAVVRYGVSADQSFVIQRDLVWPMLRTIPNDTHGSLIRSLKTDPISSICINGGPVKQESVTSFRLNGKIVVSSLLNQAIQLTRTLFPSVDLPVFCEKYEFANHGNKPVFIDLPEFDNTIRTLPDLGLEGSYTISAYSVQHGAFRLQPGEKATYFLLFSAGRSGDDIRSADPENELAKREAFLGLMAENLVLETPDSLLNRMFSFAKIRASESIYQTKGGPMHGPGGLRYYAAIWANDQAEYVNPFFPYLGYDYGVESALNSFRHFARFMNPGYKPIPSSIIAEGIDTWHGAADRGDGAMIAYGAARFALSQGDPNIAGELWPLIEWCLEFNRRKLNQDGVVSSDSDELEGRFPSGKANLNTSCLYYDALISAAYLAKDLGKNKSLISSYQKQAATLKKNIEKYFGATVMGFDTYRYYDGNEVLRAWISTPLTVGIFDRKQGTIDALFSPELWTADGLASVSGDKTFWDRSTLYGLRGVFAASDTERGLEYLQYYSARRLLGDHVPYAVEAFPEGNQRHLSAESGLYCRIFTEGLFGIRPLSLSAFSLTPQLPEAWEAMKLKNVHGFQQQFDIEVTRENEMIRVKVFSGEEEISNQVVNNGESVLVRFN